MKTAPTIGQTVFFVSNSMTVMEGIATRVCPASRNPCQTIIVEVAGHPRPKDISEIEADPKALAREVQANHCKKIVACEKRLARLRKSLAKAEAYLPQEERTP